MSDERLLPCPFCGGEAKVAHEYTEAWKLEYVMCFRCGCSTPPAISEYTVIQIWNTIKPMERIVEKLENELELADKEKERSARENPLQFDSAKGYATGIYNAIEIVKGGGVDE